MPGTSTPGIIATQQTTISGIAIPSGWVYTNLANPIIMIIKREKKGGGMMKKEKKGDEKMRRASIQ